MKQLTGHVYQKHWSFMAGKRLFGESIMLLYDNNNEQRTMNLQFIEQKQMEVVQYLLKRQATMIIESMINNMLLEAYSTTERLRNLVNSNAYEPFHIESGQFDSNNGGQTVTAILSDDINKLYGPILHDLFWNERGVVQVDVMPENPEFDMNIITTILLHLPPSAIRLMTEYLHMPLFRYTLYEEYVDCVAYLRAQGILNKLFLVYKYSNEPPLEEIILIPSLMHYLQYTDWVQNTIGMETPGASTIDTQIDPLILIRRQIDFIISKYSTEVS